MSRSFGVQGNRSKFRVSESIVLQTTKLNRILDFDRDNYTVTVQAGALVQDVRKEIESGATLPVVAGEGTLGGIIASKSSAVPMLRDQILGCEFFSRRERWSGSEPRP